VGGAHQLLAAPRGPIFLAWPNVAHPEADRDPALHPNGWAFAVASLEYVRAVDFARPLAPPTGDAAAQRGAALFQRHCQHCHAARGAGGMAGFDLVEPSILAYRGEAYVRAYVNDPRAKNPAGHMPPFRGKLAAAELDALVAWLRALAK
jgi:mono/diheme cytochrome c family protein